MKTQFISRLFSATFTCVLAIVLSMNYCQAESLWDKAKAEDLWNKTKTAVSDTTSKVVDTADDMINSDDPTPQQERQTIDDNAQESLFRLFKESHEAKELYDQGAGYAVFDSREFAFLIKTGFGSGVAVNKTNYSRTYMKMASGGLNIGGGVKYIQVIFIFPTEQTLNDFVDNGWTEEGEASAVGGKDSSKYGITLADGTKVYELVDTGLMLKMSISGTKYWKDTDLN